MKGQTEDRIMEYLRRKEEPVSTRELSEELGVSLMSVKRALSGLVEKSEISRAGNPRYSMWILEENHDASETGSEKTRETSLREIANVKGASEEIHEKMCAIEKRVNEIYFNIIELMGIFVAVLSLIITNAQRVYDSQTMSDLCLVIIGFILSNVSTVLGICALICCIRCILGIGGHKRFKGSEK